MKHFHTFVLTFASVALLTGTVLSQDSTPAKKTDEKKSDAKAVEKKDDGRLPHTKLMPAQLTPNLCVVTYRVSTSSPECQAFFDQGLGYYYSYVWMEAARCFETAAKHDPSCALARWGLSKACAKWG